MKVWAANTRTHAPEDRGQKKGCLIHPRGLYIPLRGRSIILVLKQLLRLHANFDRPMDLHTKLTLVGYDAGTTEVDTTTPSGISKRIQLSRKICTYLRVCVQLSSAFW
jgi:hypothetical protein